jgi:hypothetical protein
MTKEEEQEIEETLKKRSFRPPMDTAEDISHEAHIKKLREQQKKQPS